MALSDTELHHIELFLSLDYLLNHTDEKHPATQKKICDYIKGFKDLGDENPRRQRIGECLMTIEDIYSRYKKQLPFVLAHTDGYKYYIESKNYLTDVQAVNVIKAIKNYQSLDEDETNDLIREIPKIFGTSEDKQKEISEEAERLMGKQKKISNRNKLKRQCVEAALRESKLLKIRVSHFVFDSNGQNPVRNTEDCWYRVYSIAQYENKPFAVLLPINRSGIWCEPIDTLNIPVVLNIAVDKQPVFLSDEKDRDLNQLYLDNNKSLSSHHGYHSVGEVISREKRIGGIEKRTIFFFCGVYLKSIEASFEEFFSCEMKYKDYSKVSINYDNKRKAVSADRINPIMTEPFIRTSPDDVPPMVVVDMEIGSSSFFRWILSDSSVEDKVTIVLPTSVLNSLGKHHLNLLKRYKDNLLFEKVEIVEKKRDAFQYRIEKPCLPKNK